MDRASLPWPTPWLCASRRRADGAEKVRTTTEKEGGLSGASAAGNLPCFYFISALQLYELTDPRILHPHLRHRWRLHQAR